MPKFKVEDRCNSFIEVEVYEVEAESAQEAVDLYCEKLAGSLSPLSSYRRGLLKEGEEEISVVD